MKLNIPKIPLWVWLVGGAAVLLYIQNKKAVADQFTGLSIHLHGATPGGVDPRTRNKYAELRA